MAEIKKTSSKEVISNGTRETRFSDALEQKLLGDVKTEDHKSKEIIKGKKDIKRAAFEESEKKSNIKPPSAEGKNEIEGNSTNEEQHETKTHLLMQEIVSKSERKESKDVSGKTSENAALEAVKKYSRISDLPPTVMGDLRDKHTHRYSRVSESYSNVSGDISEIEINRQQFPKKTAMRVSETRSSDQNEVPLVTEKKIKYVDNVEITSEGDKSDLTDKKIKLRFSDEEIKEDVVRLTPKGMRFEYGRCPKTCERYLNIEEFSRIFVDEITEEAISKGRGFRQQSAIRVVEGISYAETSEESLSIASIGTYVCVLEWPTIEEFTVEVGIAKIKEYLSYWKFEEDWKYCINFMHGESDAACDFYRYEAIFSIPCKQYPIPQATASVYFTFELSRIRPKHCLVDVYYCFEGQRLIHTPGKFTFQEERLFNIVDAKIKFYKTLTF